jgi:arylsulfatase A-like enzyme
MTASPLADRPGPRRPNVLWICADDFAASVSGAYGNRQVRTPSLDRLAAGALRFDRAYCNCPLSTPSRQAFWTGRYPRSIGVTLSPTPLPDDEVTLPVLLRAAGYEAVAVGKTHYYSPRRHEFDRVTDLAEHRAWLGGRGPEPLPPGLEVLGPWRPFLDPVAVWLNSRCLPYGATDADMPGTFLAAEAARFLREKRERPFFLYVSFYEPHAPFRFPVEFRGRHDPKSFAVPEVLPAERDELPLVFRDLSREQKQGILAAYYTCVEHLDKNIGTILDALDASGNAGHTLVLFTSDHGYLLGEHGRFEKHCCYEPAIRAALLMRHPGTIASGRSSAALVELIDIFPTILDLCGVPAPVNVQGRSLLPLLRGEVDTHREHVIAEYADNEEAMIRTGRWKLIYSTGRRRRRDGYALGPIAPGQSIRLYDMETDPDEHVNLAAQRKYADQVNDLLASLADHLRRTARDPQPLPETSDVHAILAHGLAPVEKWP